MLKSNEMLWDFSSKPFGEVYKGTEITLYFVQKRYF